MSGLEVFSAVAAGLSIVDFIGKARDSCHSASTKLKSLEKDRIMVDRQATILHIALRGLADRLSKCDEQRLTRDEKHTIAVYLDDLNNNVDACQRAVKRLRDSAGDPKALKAQLDASRAEFARAEGVIGALQGCFTIQMTHGRPAPSRVDTDPPVQIQACDRRKSESDAQGLGSHEGTELLLGEGLTRPWTHNTSLPSKILTDPPQRISSLWEDPQLQEAISEDSPRRVQQFIKRFSDPTEILACRSIAFLLACERRKRAVVEALLAQGVDCSITYDGRGAMHRAIGSSGILQAEQEQVIVDIVKLLAKRGVPVGCLDEQTDESLRKRPLHLCALSGNKLRVAKCILRINPYVLNLKDGKGRTALFDLFEQHNPDERFVELLLRKGAVFGSEMPPKVDNEQHKKVERLWNEALSGRRELGGPRKHSV